MTCQCGSISEENSLPLVDDTVMEEAENAGKGAVAKIPSLGET